MIEGNLSLEPLHFFAIGADLLYFKGMRGTALPKSHTLPVLSSFFGKKAFAQVALGWNEEGIFAEVHSGSRTPRVFFPDFQKGDSIELFFDTRDMKNVGYSHKFCHHFFFLPLPFEEEGEKIQGGEITKFRGEERHELADSSLFFIDCKEGGKKGYVLHIFIPKECLFGYDPSSFHRLGFTYRINQSGGLPQYFSASAEEYSIEQHPSLWASLDIITCI